MNKNTIKKYIVLILSTFLCMNFSYAATLNNKCWSVTWSNLDSIELSQLLEDCKPKWTMEIWNKKSMLGWLLTVSVDNTWYKIENAKQKIYSVMQKMVVLAAILAMWWLVYSWILFTTSYWDEAKNKKAKEAAKWSIIWFFVAVIAQQLVNAVVNFIYWVSS